VAFLISVIDAAARKGHTLFKDKGTGMRAASSALWTKLASEQSICSVLSSVLNGPLVNRSGRLCSTKETANW